MTSHNGYANIPGYGLYDTTGGTEDWTFWTAGSLGYTFEIGPNGFHPPYNNSVVDEYLGRGQADGAGKGGNREAYYEMLACDEGRRPTTRSSRARRRTGSTLTIRKSFLTDTSPVWNNDYGTDIGDALRFPDTLEYSMVTDGPTFEWDVNPSTRPVVAGRDGRTPAEGAAAGFDRAAQPGRPAGGEHRRPARGSARGGPVHVQGMPDVDNGRFTVHIEWADPNTDWDLYIYDSSGNVVAQSAAFGDTTEDAVLFDPPAGTYTAVIVNYDQVDGAAYDDWSNGSVTFQSPKPRVENPVRSRGS